MWGSPENGIVLHSKGLPASPKGQGGSQCLGLGGSGVHFIPTLTPALPKYK